MTTETMTIHKALCELKLLDSRIVKEISGTQFVFANKHANTKVAGVDIEQYKAEIVAKHQSINDLINRRNAIKKAVVQSNAVTKVTVCGVEYTIAEAIDMKQHGCSLKRKLVDKVAQDYNRSRMDAASNNENALEARAKDYITSLYGNTDMRNASKDAQEAYDNFIKAQTYDVVDPICAVDVIEKLKAEIDKFAAEVDSALSVSNALKTIEISY